MLVCMCMYWALVVGAVAGAWWYRRRSRLPTWQSPGPAPGPAPGPVPSPPPSPPPYSTAACRLTKEEVDAWANECEPLPPGVSSYGRYASGCVLAKALQKCGKPAPAANAPGLYPFTPKCPDPYPDIYRPGITRDVRCGCCPDRPGAACCKMRCTATVGTDYYATKCSSKTA